MFQGVGSRVRLDNAYLQLSANVVAIRAILALFGSMYERHFKSGSNTPVFGDEHVNTTAFCIREACLLLVQRISVRQKSMARLSRRVLTPGRLQDVFPFWKFRRHVF